MKLLSSCSLGRPIYADENEVRKAIAQRSDLQREAYVEVVVDKNFIMDLPEEKRPKDHLGASLLVLKANAIILHLSGCLYMRIKYVIAC